MRIRNRILQICLLGIFVGHLEARKCKNGGKEVLKGKHVSLNIYSNLARVRLTRTVHGRVAYDNIPVNWIGMFWRSWLKRTFAWNWGIDFSNSNFRKRALTLSWTFLRFLVSSFIYSLNQDFNTSRPRDGRGTDVIIWENR